MKNILTSVALLFALGASVPVAQVHAQERQEQGIWNENEAGIWESDNFGADTYGAYDEDFDWETDDNNWNTWYGDSAEYWNTYDDVGDEGWLDV